MGGAAGEDRLNLYRLSILAKSNHITSRTLVCYKRDYTCEITLLRSPYLLDLEPRRQTIVSQVPLQSVRLVMWFDLDR